MPSVTKKQGEFRIKTPAKITPYLRVLAAREDGFHEVRIVLVPVSIFDSLSFRHPAAGGFSLAVDSPWELGAAEDNLVYRAARAFQEASGIALDLHVRLSKAIPAGAGLGGGSGNAAGTLVALNAIHGRPLSRPKLLETALGLGSDVPFFLSPAPTLAEGRGEKLSSLPPFPTLHLAVVQPPFSISTGDGYRGVKPRAGGARPRFATKAELQAGMVNDFEEGLFPRHGELRAIKARLLELGAKGALLSGSGSALFGWYANRRARDKALRALNGESTWRAIGCETLAAHRYLPGG